MSLKPGYKQTEIGVIPDDWETVRVAEILRIRHGKNQSQVQVADGAYPILASGGEIGRSKSFLYDKPSVLIGRKGTIDKPQYMESPFWTVDTLFFSEISPNNFPKFVYYKFCSIKWRSFNEASGVPSLNAATIENIVVSRPPLKEQKAIAEALSDVDALINSLEALLTKKRNIKTGVMQELLTGRTRLAGFTDDWKEVRLGDCASMGSGGTPLSTVKSFYGGDIPWVSIADMTSSGRFISNTEKTLSHVGLANSSAQMFPVDTILYAMYASLGECSKAVVELCTSQAILGIKCGTRLLPDFLYYSLVQRKNLVKTMGQQGTQSNLNKEMVENFRIPLPDLAEQKAIATVLSDIDDEIQVLEKRLVKTRDLKQGMAQELLTGRTRLV